MNHHQYASLIAAQEAVAGRVEDSRLNPPDGPDITPEAIAAKIKKLQQCGDQWVDISISVSDDDNFPDILREIIENEHMGVARLKVLIKECWQERAEDAIYSDSARTQNLLAEQV